jgi:Kazal-type serine protease inhibitor domain
MSTSIFFRRFIGLLTTTLVLVAPLAAHSDEAADLGEACVGLAGTPCIEGLLCDPLPGMCATKDWSGVCVSLPEKCDAQYLPVCGCDSKTYSNDCVRLRARAIKFHDGACETDGSTPKN